MSGDWSDPAAPPVPATDLGGVWVSWATVFNVGDEPLIWHWCTFEDRWKGAGVRAHTLLSRDPLHLEPSLLWDACCGLHGFIRGGAWIEV